jgi:hypothetical protein
MATQDNIDTTVYKFRCPVDLLRRIRRIAEAEDRTMAKQIIRLLEEATNGKRKVR